jgi:hypothetical protein
MQSELQILEEKFKDIKARLGAAISIIEEAERVFNRSQSTQETVDASGEEIVKQISRAAAFDVVNSRTEPIYKYLQGLGGADSINNIWAKFFNDYGWDFELMENSIRSDSRFAFRAEGLEDIVFVNEARVTTTSIAQKPAKRLTSEDILKYLQKKPEGVTLKQIQSRFKGYSGAKCSEILRAVEGHGGCWRKPNKHLSKVIVSLKPIGVIS